MSSGPAVLILAFNRPDLLRRTIDAVLAGNPKRVYLNIDGPRSHVPSDSRLVSEVLNVVQETLWSCPVEIRSHPSNRGLGDGVVEAISWFFSLEISGVILEDDVCISPTSLLLAQELLDRFEGDPSVGSVTLFNPVPRRHLAEPKGTFRLSRIPSSQYWGTWRDRWEARVPNIHGWQKNLSSADLQVIGGPKFSRFLTKAWDLEVDEGTINWEGCWMATHWFNKWSVVTTNENYCLHTGFSAAATNSFEQPSWYPTTLESWTGQIKPPQNIQIDQSADFWRLNQRYGLSNVKLIKRTLGQQLPWLRRSWRRLTIRSKF